MENKQIDILDILLILAKHKKFIFFTTLIVSVLIVIYSLLVPQIWKSTTVIAPVSQQGFSAENAIIGQLSSSFLNQSSSSRDIIPIIESRTFLTKILKQFDIIEYLEITEEDSLIANYLAIESLREEIIEIEESIEKGTVTIDVYTKDKYYSAKIANYITQELDRFNREERLTKGKQNREFIENRVDEVESNISKFTLDLQKFQEENDVVDLANQISTQMNIYAELIAKYEEKSIELKYSQEFYSKDSFLISKLVSERDNLKELIMKYEKGNPDELPKYFIDLNKISETSRKYYSIKLKLQIQNKIYEMLYPQYELSKLQEIRDLPTIQIIDRAIPAGKRSKPRRGFICIIAFIMAVVISSCYVIILEVILNYLKRDSKHEKWMSIKKNILKK